MRDTASHPVLSIVTVTFRDADGLRATLDSLETVLSDPRVECIVVDGSMDPATRAHCEAMRVRLISEPDDGIYDAMNKGVSAAHGKYIWFLNGGDRASGMNVAAWRALVDLLCSENEEMHTFGYEIESDRRRQVRSARPGVYIWHALPSSHQAILFPREATLRVGGYDLSYVVSADYQLAACLFKDGLRFRRHRQVIARFVTGGTSTVNAAQIAVDAGRVQREILRLPRLLRGLSRGLHTLSVRVRAALHPSREQ
ncbi:glycosyltransferase [Microbacterium xanthum]|uniref:glycosyltransferase n=1 Tax=Microbacterium xanthum TaxID=3079794 RepID=UPI003A100741